MSLPVAALACESDKNLKTFGSSLDVLPERSSARLVFSRSRCGVPADERIRSNVHGIEFSLADSVVSARGHWQESP